MSIEIKPLTPTFGAEIKGVDLASSSAADFDEVLEIFSKYGVIFFRDQNKLSEEAKAHLQRIIVEARVAAARAEAAAQALATTFMFSSG